jgi:hypothetical protein
LQITLQQQRADQRRRNGQDRHAISQDGGPGCLSRVRLHGKGGQPCAPDWPAVPRTPGSRRQLASPLYPMKFRQRRAERYAAIARTATAKEAAACRGPRLEVKPKYSYLRTSGGGVCDGNACSASRAGKGQAH